jgi:hypothetical protein
VVPVEVRRALEDARRRGEDFTVAWDAALRLARGDWREALRATVPAWRAAYEGTPPSTAELALQNIARSPAGQLWDLARAYCATCDKPMSATRPSLYCGRACQQIADRRRAAGRQQVERALAA